MVIDIPKVGQVDFPDSMSEKEINAAAKKLFDTLPRFRKGILWLNYDGTDAKDIGDMADEQIVNAISSASAIPKWFK